jgi:hypothetical protein
MTASSMAQAALSYVCWLRPECRGDVDAIEVWITQDNASVAVAMWLLIDDQVTAGRSQFSAPAQYPCGGGV